MEWMIALTAGSLVLLYFLPTLLVIRDREKSRASIFVVNLFLGWTLVGWVVALAWAIKREPPTNLKQV